MRKPRGQAGVHKGGRLSAVAVLCTSLQLRSSPPLQNFRVPGQTGSPSNPRTSSQGARRAAQSSMLRFSTRLGVSVMGSGRTWLVVGHLFRPLASHRSMLVRSYLSRGGGMGGWNGREARDRQEKSRGRGMPVGGRRRSARHRHEPTVARGKPHRTSAIRGEPPRLTSGRWTARRGRA